MLKKILGEAPFEISLKGNAAVSCNKKCDLTLVFENTGEYDYPVSCTVRIHSLLKADKTDFDIVVPAEGRTEQKIVFCSPNGAKISGGKKLCELALCEGVFESKSEYEFELAEEMAYKCCLDKERAAERSDEVLFSRDGVFFGNKGEVIAAFPLCLEEKQVRIDILSGSIKEYENGDIIKLVPPLSLLCFEFAEDGSFEFSDPATGEKVYLETLNPKYFTGELL